MSRRQTPETYPDYAQYGNIQQAGQEPGITGGLEAFVADSNVVDATEVAVVISEEEEEEIQRKQLKKFIVISCITLLAVILVVVVPVLVWVGKNNNDNNPTPIVVNQPTEAPSGAPSARPSAAPTSNDIPPLVDCLRGVVATDVDPFVSRNSPQYLAMEWLVNDDPYVRQQGVNCPNPKFLQRYALATFYFAMKGDEWKICNRRTSTCDRQAWLSDADECEWFKIKCDNATNTVVIIINFADNIEADRVNTMLSGTIPQEMLLLTGLQEFVVGTMQISGTLGTQIASWSSIKAVILVGNSLTGTLPSTLPENNPKLTTLQVSSNNFSGTIPTTLGNLLHMQDLRLHDNLFTGSIPTELGLLVNLTNLDLKTNNLTGQLPTELLSHINLVTLNIQGNAQIVGTLPSLFDNMQKLTSLNLAETNFGGTLPSGLFQLTNMVELNLSQCMFNGTLSEDFAFWNQTLRKLVLNNNSFTGPIPKAFDVISNLEQLFLQGNHLTGTISQTLCASEGTRWGELKNLTVDCNIACNCCTTGGQQCRRP